MLVLLFGLIINGRHCVTPVHTDILALVELNCGESCVSEASELEHRQSLEVNVI